MKPLLSTLLALGLLTSSSSAWSQLAPGSLDVHWNDGAKDCAAKPQPPIQVQRYNARTFILRENLCATYEAPFVYLMVGSTKALLIDTGDVADPKQTPLAKTVMGLLPGDGQLKMPLIVVHTHGHQDHRAGDRQFEHLPNVQVIPADLGHVRKYFGFTDWPNGLAQMDLGDRTIDVMPAPGHHPSHVAFYDRNTGLFFSGDILLPGRLLIDDIDAALASAKRVADFIKDRPVSHVLGGHIELNLAGETFPSGSQYHPQEHALPLTKAALIALPAVLSGFNGFYARIGSFIVSNPIHNLLALGSVTVVVLIALGMWLRRYLLRRKTNKRSPKGDKP